MKKLSWILGFAALGGLAGVAAKRLRPSLAPEGDWKDVAAKPSINGSHPDAG